MYCSVELTDTKLNYLVPFRFKLKKKQLQLITGRTILCKPDHEVRLKV